MPVVESSIEVPVPSDVAFAVSQTTGTTRKRWDPFIRRQHFVDGAAAPGKGVRTMTQHRLGPSMISEYVSYNPPTNVGMRMVSGPWFFQTFAGGWRFTDGDEPGSSIAVWRYSFTVRPAWLQRLADPIGVWFLSRDIRRRIEGFARGCRDDLVLEAARAEIARWDR